MGSHRDLRGDGDDEAGMLVLGHGGTGHGVVGAARGVGWFWVLGDVGLSVVEVIAQHQPLTGPGSASSAWGQAAAKSNPNYPSLDPLEPAAARSVLASGCRTQHREEQGRRTRTHDKHLAPGPQGHPAHHETNAQSSKTHCPRWGHHAGGTTTGSTGAKQRRKSKHHPLQNHLCLF